MKPILIIPPGQIHSDGIKMLRDNGICVVTAKDPAALKFVEPLPTASSRTEVEVALMTIGRLTLSGTFLMSNSAKAQCEEKFSELLTKPPAK